MVSPLLELHNISRSLQSESGQFLFKDVNISVNEGDIVVIQGQSGSGKSTLLKCIAHLVLYDGHVLYRGRTPQSYSVPLYRTRVLYVPQRPSLLPGSPQTFLSAITSLKSHKDATALSTPADVAKRAREIAGSWGVAPELWDRQWSNLSGGEAQRIVLAAALALGTAEVLLLDEPTSALDPRTSALVEDYLVEKVASRENGLMAVLWITHSDDQGRRVGNRFLRLSGRGCEEEESVV